MSQLLLRELTLDDERAFITGLADWDGEDLSWYTFVWKPGMTFAEHLDALKRGKQCDALPANRVPSTMLYGFVEGEIVGRLSVRHELNEQLRRYGGHFGYAVSPRHRRRGFATQIFAQGLLFCEALGLDKILVTCAADNVGSVRLIERFGGSLQDEVFAPEVNALRRRYWVNVAQSPRP